MRNISGDKLIRDKFDVIVKSGMLGEYSNDLTRRDRHNKKYFFILKIRKNKMVVRQKNNFENDHGLNDEKLKVYN